MTALVRMIGQAWKTSPYRNQRQTPAEKIASMPSDTSPADFVVNVPAANPSQDYSVRREKALCVSQVQVLSGELSGHPSSYQDGQKGN